MSRPKTVAIIGGGPVGLAAAVHALGRGLTPVVLEAGDSVGHAVRQWSHVRMFSPWTYNVDKSGPCSGLSWLTTHSVVVAVCLLGQVSFTL